MPEERLASWESREYVDAAFRDRDRAVVSQEGGTARPPSHGTTPCGSGRKSHGSPYWKCGNANSWAVDASSEAGYGSTADGCDLYAQRGFRSAAGADWVGWIIYDIGCIADHDVRRSACAFGGCGRDIRNATAT